jgi:glycosyltransferase involved in cell wall biosynthesis
MVVTNSDGTKKWVKSICGNINVSVLNPSPNIRGKPISRLSTGVVQLLTVGNIRRIKGFHVLLGALKDVDRRSWKLKIFGRIKEKDYYHHLLDVISEKKLQDSVTIVTNGDQPALINAYCGADIYIQPSIEEGYGMAIAEAMTFGLPVIASNTGGIPELVKDGSNGYLVTPGNERELCQRISLLMREPAQRFVLGKTGWKMSEDFPDWAENAEMFIKILDAL